jgi:hypothetical protein
MDIVQVLQAASVKVLDRPPRSQAYRFDRCGGLVMAGDPFGLAWTGGSGAHAVEEWVDLAR